MTEFDDFKPFFDAMVAEMKRHDHEFDDSWKNPALWVSNNLDNKINRCFHHYWRNESLDELIDIANLCAMRWIRGCKESAKE